MEVPKRVETVIAMLRGVNVGGHNKISMEVLRELCGGLKFRDARTYVQSGNVVFRCAANALAGAAERMEKAIEAKAGFRPRVVLRTAGEMRDVVARNPFAGRAEIEPAKLAVNFLAGSLDEDARARIGAIGGVPEEVVHSGRELFIYFPNGMGRPKLNLAALERGLKVACTSRNWNTVTKLCDMAREMEQL